MKLPLSERAAQVVCLGFALWTLCAHLVVFAGGSLISLMLVYVVAGGAALFVARRLRGDEDAGFAAEATSAAGGAPGAERLRPAALAIAALAAGTALLRDDPITTWLLWVALLALAAGVFLLREPPEPEAPLRSRAAEGSLWALALLCALYTLCVHRPDADDAFYIDLAIAAIDLPELPLLARDTIHGRFDLPIHYPAYRLHGYELWNAALAKLTGLSALATFHFVAAALAALLVPLCHAVLFRSLTPRHWIFATLALVVVLAAPGETHRWYGNFAFVRMWQGKSIFLFVFMPLVYAYALQFALRGDRGSWLRLAAAQIAALGCTSTAIWAGPAGALMAMSAVLRPVPRDLRRLGIGALSCAYPIVAGLALKGDMSGAIPELAQTFAPGVQLAGALHTALGDGRLYVVCVVALFAAWALCPRGLARRFAITLPLAVALVLLNPWADAWVRENVSGPSLWRVMWALPVPILLALVAVAPLSLRVGTPRLRAAACLLLLALFALAVPRFPGFDARNEGASLGWPRLKLPANERWSRVVNEIAPRQRVVAPPAISTWIPIRHDHAYPLSVRVYLKPLRGQIGELAYRDRVLMTRFVDGDATHPRAAAIFERGLDLYDVKAACLRAGATTAQARRILRRAGFGKRMQGTDLEIWAR